jgi:hypothetical protein
MVAGTARKHAAAHQVRLCEEQLEVLRNELLDASRDLEEVEGDINSLRILLQQPATSTSTFLPLASHISCVDARPIATGDISADGYSSDVSYGSTSLESSNFSISGQSD